MNLFATNEKNEDFTRTVTFLVLWLIVGLVGIILQGAIARATAFLMAIAAIACGAILGFLFGIPRGDIARRANEKTPANSSTEVEESDNSPSKTNLEEIADWLTKVLLGAGLTQIGQIPTALEAMASRVSGEANSNTVPIVISIWLYCGILGFFLGYLITRLFLTRALIDAEEDAANAKIRVAGDIYQLGDVLVDIRRGISDLQDHVVRQAAAELPPGGRPEATATERAQEVVARSVGTLLWVDDAPPSDALLVEKLQSQNIVVSTRGLSEGFPDKQTFDRVVIVVRDGKHVADTQLLAQFAAEAMSSVGGERIVIYCTPENKSDVEAQIDPSDVAGITSSPVDLLTLLQLSSF